MSTSAKQLRELLASAEVLRSELLGAGVVASVEPMTDAIAEVRQAIREVEEVEEGE